MLGNTIHHKLLPMARNAPRTYPPRDLFVQDPPRIGNQWLEDSAFVDILKRLLPSHIFEEINPDLTRFGERVSTDVLCLAKEAGEQLPRLQQVDGFGKRVDNIKTAKAWSDLHVVSAEEGLIAIGYERKYGPFSRIYQYAKLYLFFPSSGLYGCPLAMTDGAARLLELHGDEETKRRALPLLITRDPARFWTSGQWMTERTGGSDVGNTETLAYRRSESSDPRAFELDGYKFFTSATTADMAITLARVVDEHGNTVPSSRGLSAFYVETRDSQGRLNGIRVAKLKDKLGTKQLPTAELELVGTPARLIGPVGKGVAVIASMFNITRIHNAVSSVSAMRRSIAWVRDYAHRRRTFGKLLCEHSLFLDTLARMEVEFRGNLQMVFDTCRLMGAAECAGDERTAAAAEAQLRLVTPLLKLYTAKASMAVVGEALEALGAMGYMEDATQLPTIFRDNQVTPIWEGTTNILSLDVLRALARSPGSFAAFAKAVQQSLDRAATVPALQCPREALAHALAVITAFVRDDLPAMGHDLVEAHARRLAFSLARLFGGSLLLDHAVWSANDLDAFICHEWCKELVLLPGKPDLLDSSRLSINKRLALDIDPVSGRPRGMGDICPVSGKPRSKY